jgi:hypothetical protein
MEKLLATLDESLEEIELKVVQENTVADDQSYRLPAGLAERKALREQIKTGLAQLAADHRHHYHPVEPEARRMKIDDTNRYAYNAQAIADSQEGIIVACEVTRQETDGGQLVPMIAQARENLGPAAQQTLTVADAGYGAGADLLAAQEKQMSVLAPPAEGSPAHDKPYATQHFRYDPTTRILTCPRDHQLDHEGSTVKKGALAQRYRCHNRDCPVRSQCTRDPKGRQIEIWPHTAVVQVMRHQLAQTSTHAQWSRRQEMIERCFGHIKEHDAFRRWTVWGLEGAKTQWSLLCATLNLKTLYRRWKENRKTPHTQVASAVKTGFCLLHSATSFLFHLRLHSKNFASFTFNRQISLPISFSENF